MNAPGPDEVHLPRLAVFRKYSLALRREFADAEEVAAVLRETLTALDELLAETGSTERTGPKRRVRKKPKPPPEIVPVPDEAPRRSRRG